MMANPSLSLVVPAYNEAQNLQVLIPIWIKRFEILMPNHDVEIWICDDHSTDKTLELVKNFNDSRINYIRLSRRSGSHAAIRAGLSRAKGNMVLCMAADGQEDLAPLDEMMSLLDQGHHIVWAVRKKRKENLFVSFPAKLFYKTLSYLVNNEKGIDLAHADYYLLSEIVVKAINQCKERNTSLFGLLIWLGFSQCQVLYERKDRLSGNSKWNVKQRFKLASDWIISFSGLPLKLMSILGLVFSVSAFLYSFVIFVLWLGGFIIPGWAETIVLVLTLGGIQMLMIGILGSYVWRILDETRNRPLFFIETESNTNLSNE